MWENLGWDGARIGADCKQKRRQFKKSISTVFQECLYYQMEAWNQTLWVEILTLLFTISVTQSA